MGKRRRARELALQYLYQWDFHGPEAGEPGAPFWETRRDADHVKEFAREIVEGVKAEGEELDRLIESASKHWKVYRMNRIDRNILRIAVYEFTRQPEIPPKVTIDEAIEMGKKFGTSESGAFINGILDQLWKKISGSIKKQDQVQVHDAASDRKSG